MIGIVALWKRLRTPRIRNNGRRTLRSSAPRFERYGFDLLERRQMLAVAPVTDFTYTTANGQVAITGYTGSAASVKIPATINGLPVKSIGDNAFANRTILTSVILPNSITTIGNNAFRGCSTLASVTIPLGVTTIGGFAFSDCYSLTTVTIPASVTNIVSNPFTLCTSLTTITVSSDNSTYSSSDGVLYTKDRLSLLAYPWGKGAALQTGEVTIPSSVVVVGDEAFSNCTWLKSVTIPTSVTSIGNAAFWACDGLTTVDMPDSVTGTGTSVFQDCSFLRSVKLSNSLTHIEAGLFSLCSALTAVIIPDSVTYVGDGAFQDCISLTSIVIPAGVTSMGDEAFKACTALTVVRMQGNPPTVGTAVFEGVNPSQAVVYYPAGTSGWTDTYGGLPTRPYGVPDAPSAVTAMRGNGQVQLSWTAPASPGWPPVRDYTVQFSTDGSSWQTFGHGASSTTSAVVTGLTNGTGYVFRVASVNDLGTSVYSANSALLTPATVPDAPTAVTGIRGNGQVVLSWTAPLSNGGLAVRSYTVQYSTDGSSWQTFSHAESSSTSATVPGLRNGTGYVFRVAGVNDVGTGVFSASSSRILPSGVPLPPSNVIASRGKGVVNLSWTAPAMGGVRIRDYAVQSSTDGGISWVTVRDGVSARASAVINGLVAGRAYVFRIASVGRFGAGDFSMPSGVVTPVKVPTAPARLVASGGARQAVLSWNTPTSNGGVPISGYVVQYAAAAGRWVTSTTVGSDTTTATVSGLLANRTYSFRVLAVNDIGTSPASRVVAAKTLRASQSLIRA